MPDLEYRHSNNTTFFEDSGRKYLHQPNNRGRPTLTLYLDDVVIHVDRINLDSDRDRQAFSKRVSRKSDFDISEIERELLVLSQLHRPAPKSRNQPRVTSIPNFHRTELGNAERLLHRHGKNLRYVPAFRKCLIWDGCRWCIDDDHQVERMAMNTFREMWAEVPLLDDARERAAFAEFVKASERAYGIKAAVELARMKVATAPESLDTDPWLFNVKNGTLDLRTQELREHRREDLITRVSDIVYDPNAEAPVFEAFLQRIFDGNDEIIRFVQQYAGYSLTGSTKEQVLAIWYGPTGSNGKSTLMNILMDVLGSYAKQTATDTFMAKRAGGVPNDIAALKGARFVAAVESEEGQRFSESLVKQLTGGDRISARFMRAEWFEFVPEFKIVLVTNNKPDVRESAHAFWRRVRLVPFTVTIPDHEQDKDLSAKLRSELPGILGWAVRGCADWLQNGLVYPNEIKEATESYRREQDELAEWFDECCFFDSDIKTPTSELYRSYKNWATRTNVQVMSQNQLGRQLKKRGFEPDRNRVGRFYLGIGLRGVETVTHLRAMTHCDTDLHINDEHATYESLYPNQRHDVSHTPNASPLGEPAESGEDFVATLSTCDQWFKDGTLARLRPVIPPMPADTVLALVPSWLKEVHSDNGAQAENAKRMIKLLYDTVNRAIGKEAA